jgi:hypothetical protein
MKQGRYMGRIIMGPNGNGSCEELFHLQGEPNSLLSIQTYARSDLFPSGRLW